MPVGRPGRVRVATRSRVRSLVPVFALVSGAIRPGPPTKTVHMVLGAGQGSLILAQNGRDSRAALQSNAVFLSTSFHVPITDSTRQVSRQEEEASRRRVSRSRMRNRETCVKSTLVVKPSIASIIQVGVVEADPSPEPLVRSVRPVDQHVPPNGDIERPVY